jgi:2'-5' RNA ligase
VTAHPDPNHAEAIGVAIAVPDPYGTALRDLSKRFGDPQALLVPPHVTLLPPTTVDRGLLAEIEQHLQTVARQTAPFPITLHGSGTFRPVSPVVFVKLVAGSDSCAVLESRIRSGVLDRPVHFGYHPHVTVAHELPDTVLDAASAELADFSAEFIVDRFTLYQHEGGAWVQRRVFAFGGVRADSTSSDQRSVTGPAHDGAT